MNNEQQNGFDSIGLLLSLWKRKFLIGACVIVCMAATAAYYYSRPLVYSATALVKVGKVAHIKIESYPDIMIYVQSAAAKNKSDAQISVAVSRFNMSTPDDLYGTLLLDVSAVSSNVAFSRKELDAFLKGFIDRHKALFDDALSRMRKSNNSIIAERAPLLFIDSYTFQTQMEGAVTEQVIRSGIRGAAQGKSGILLYLFAAFILSMAFASSIVVAYNYMSSEIRKRNQR
jgi:Chain length determinant protein